MCDITSHEGVIQGVEETGDSDAGQANPVA
jgi:hypothetical protein